MHTKLKGDIGELLVAADLLSKGWHVAFPYGENLRYDLIAEKEGKFRRVQVKAVFPREGALRINCRSSNNWSVKRYTEDEIDMIAAVNLEDKKIYYIPSRQLSSNLFNLRLRPAKNAQTKGIHFAEDFLTIK